MNLVALPIHEVYIKKCIGIDFGPCGQYAGFSSAKETNERFKLLLDRGQMGLSVAVDLPTQLGLDG